VAFGVGGWMLSHWIPINKALWTASFVFVTAGTGLAVWTTIGLIWNKVATSAPTRLAILYGQTALTLYVIHMLLLAVIVRKMPDGTRIWDGLFDRLTATGLPPAFASLLFALIAGALCTAPLAQLKRKGWLIKA
jgi:predicted acyltransferase